MTDYEFFKALTEQRVAREKQFGSYFGWSVLLFVVLSISGLDLSIQVKTPLLEISIPKVYLVFLTSLLTGMSILEMISAGLLQGYQNVAAQRFAGRFPPITVWMTPQASSSAWGSVFNTRFDALKPVASYNFGIGLAGAFIALPIGLVYLAIYVSQFTHIIAFYTRPNFAFMGQLVNLISILCMIAPLMLVIFTIKKFDMRKNQQFIRWSFLFRVYRKYGHSSDPQHWINRIT